MGDVPLLTTLEIGAMVDYYGALPWGVLVVWLGSWPMIGMRAMTIGGPSDEGSA